jgi:hypothetical protein
MVGVSMVQVVTVEPHHLTLFMEAITAVISIGAVELDDVCHLPLT